MADKPSDAAGDARNDVAVVPREGVQVRHLALTLVATAIVIYLLQTMQAVLIPLVLGGLLFCALDPAVVWLQ
jgi:predicted PurR-regulated permease PerM